MIGNYEKGKGEEEKKNLFDKCWLTLWSLKVDELKNQTHKYTEDD